MCKHDRSRMPHAGCSGDIISVLRRAQLGKRHPAHVSPHYGPDPRTSALTSASTKGEGFWAEPTQFPSASSNFVPRRNLTHPIRAALGLAFIGGVPALFWPLWGSLGHCGEYDGYGPHPEADILVEEITNKETNE